MDVLGNRGTCAQSCRLPYELLENDKTIDKGYLLSPRDLCSIENLKELIDAGVTCFKIEGRMKKPEYVATVTWVYRKYINEILETQKQVPLSEADNNNLMQVFNRGSFSHGHQDSIPNRNLVFKEKQNNMGIYIGKVFDYNENKGYVKLELENNLDLGDSVSINDSIYHVSELMINNKNVKSASTFDKITIGRMKGNNIRKYSKIYKIQSKQLSDKALKSYSNVENIKTMLNTKITVHKNKPIELFVETIENTDSFYNGISTIVKTDTIPVDALKSPITKERIISQLSKTGNTEFEFKNIDVDLEDNLYIPNISSLNELRRQALSNIENKVKENFSRKSDYIFENKYYEEDSSILEENKTVDVSNKKISVLINILNKNLDYTLMKNINKLYIPFKYFINNSYDEQLNEICNTFNTYLYLPIITKDTYFSIIKNNIKNILTKYKISGIVVSNIGQLEIVKDLNLDIVSNYSFNIFNNYSENELQKLEINTFTISPELDKYSINSILENKTMSSELIIYGSTPVMNSNYCLLGASNKCYKECTKKCMSKNKYYLKDRMGFNFRIIPDNTQTITTIYNSKILSISPSEFDSDNYRIDILDENIDEINNIISTVKSGSRIEGQNYTNGNLNRNI